MTPCDPFLNQVEPFINQGPPRTPIEPFLSPGNNPPLINAGRPPGPDQFHNFNQFAPNEPMRNQFRHDFPVNRNQDQPPFNHDRFPPNQNPNWRPNHFPAMCDNRPDFNNPNANQRFNQPEPNQYDLSQMNPIDFYDNGPNNNNRFEPEFNNPNSFRGRGNCNRGNFGRGRGGPDRTPYRDPRQFRNKGPMPPQMPNKFPPNEEPSHKEDNRRSRFDDVRDSRDHRGDRDYRRSRFSSSKEDDSSRNDRSRNTDDRYNRFSSKREEPVRKSSFVREDPRRKSIDDTTDKPKEKEQSIVDKTVIDKPPVDTKTKEEIQSPLDSLYSTETKRVGKGYGLQSFKIPKIKKTEEVKEEKLDCKTTTEEVKEVDELPKEEPVKEDLKTKEETVKPVIEEKSPDKKEEIQSEASTSEELEPVTPKTEADLKLDMFNNFMKHIFETCDSSVLFQYLDKCGFSLPNAKSKRIRRIINSDSSDTEDEQRKDKRDKAPHEQLAETPEPEEPKTTNEPEQIVETVSERIKNRRSRKPTVYSSDSSPDKSQKQPSTPEKETTEELDEDKGTRKSRCRTPKATVKPQTKSRRKNALELLQEDIREMFISEGVLTATGKRMCRMMKEHQESGFISTNTEPVEAIKQQGDAESEEEMPLVKRKDKHKVIKQDKIPDVLSLKRGTRKSPRVILEKMEFSSSRAETAASSDHSDKESGAEDESLEIKKPSVSIRRTRRSNTVSGEFLELDENGVVAKVQEKKKKLNLIDETDILDTSFEDEASSIKSDSNLSAFSKKEESPISTPVGQSDLPKKKIRKRSRRGRGGWATGVIKNKKKKVKSAEKGPDSPALTVSTEEGQQEADPESGASDDEELPKNNRPQTYDEEYSLLQVDTNEDVNYFLDNGNKFNCKLCDYKGKLIVHHYRSKHPESENMISRLSPEQASAAKIESNEFNFEEIIPYDEATRTKKRRTTFICRFCLLTFKQEFTCSFFDHICCHTGEYRYKCEKCAFSTGVKKTLSAHCHSLHPEMDKPLVIKPIYEGPPNFRLVFGYLCSACNFTQLLKPNVEKHIRVSHPDQDITIIKISMSTKPIPLTDLKKPEDEQSIIETVETNEAREEKQSTPEPARTPKKFQKAKPAESIEQQPEVPAPKEKEPNLTVFMVPEEISQQEKLIEDERLKKMEEIQSNVVPRRSKLQFVDKLKNKLDSVESEIALLESMEAENAALEAEAAAILEAATTLESAAVLEAAATLEAAAILEAPATTTLEAAASIETTEAPETIEPVEPENFPINDKPQDGWISIASTCSLAHSEQFDDQNEVDTPPEMEENLNETNSFDGFENEGSFHSLNLSPSALSQTKKTGFLDTIQRLAAQLQNNKTSSLSDCEEGERLYYSPEITPESSPQRKAQLENTELGEAIKLNAGTIEIQFFGNKNIYSCLVPQCYYTTILKTSFRKHLMDEHKNLRVNCGLCYDENDYMVWDLCGLFLHMLDQHKKETPVKKIAHIKEEPLEQSEIAIKREVLSPEKPETSQQQQQKQQPGSIRLRRISGDMLSSFSTETPIEYPTISIPENVVPEADVNKIGQEENPLYLEQNIEPPGEPGFLQISNVRTLTPEEENHLQIKMTSPPSTSLGEPLKAFKRIIPKAFILNMGDLTSSNVTKIVNKTNLKRSTSKEGTTFNFTLKPNNNEASPTLVTKTITSDSKPTKTIIFRKTPPFEATGGPKLTLIKPPKILPKGFIGTTAHPKITFVAPSTGVKVASSVLKTPVFKAPLPALAPVLTTTSLVSEMVTQKGAQQFMQPLRLSKSEFTLAIMTEHPKIMDFYKCPGVDCIFSTNDRGKFQEHLAVHKRLLPGKHCAYCVQSVTPGELVDHVGGVHGNCMYQCALCFYRASCDMYVAVHQSFCHQLDIPKFYTVNTITESEIDDGVLPRTDAILPYYCTSDGCNRTFYTINDFRVHIKVFHKRSKICSICSMELSNAELLIGHYVTHNIANFQCRYCNFGSERPQIMLKHYALDHCNRQPIVYKREYKTGTTSAHPNEVAKLEDIVEVNLSYLLKPSRLVPQQPLETQNHIPAAEAASISEEPNELDELPLIAEESTTKNTTQELLIDPKTGELTPPPLHGFREPEITLKHRNEESLKAITDAVDPLILDVQQTDDLEDNEPEEYYEDSGLNGCELYICGTSECGAKLPHLKDFKDHMYSCDVLTHDVGWYTCFHCKKRFKYVGALIKHLTVHGPQKYTCSLCPAKAHLETLILKHMKVQHKIPLAKLVPVDKTNPDSDLTAVAIKPRANKQKSKKDDEEYEKELQDAIKHTREQIELIENDGQSKKSDDRNAFGPEDVEKLPRPPIFAHEIRCKVCSYSTKVRSNMLKHLKAHIENKPVAESAPVNPVPCLEKNELMFDKMTNLAASSHTSGRMGAKKEEKKPPQSVNYPGFVAANKRFVCGSSGCNYLTHGDSMLRHHLSALHIDEPSYRCPHCQVDLAPEGLSSLAVDNILLHLKMHDLHLYKCNESDCHFYHYQKHKIERHAGDHHPTKATYTIIRELDTSANLEDTTIHTTTSSPEKSHESSDEAASSHPWRCGFCDYKSATRTSVQSHASTVHKIRSQFKCGSCEFRCSAKNNYQTHFKNKHPNEKVNIMSVYYKIDDPNASNSNLSSSDVETTTKSFDTTPLWTKNRTGVKHIRGILLDDAPVAKRPRIIEKLEENATEEIKAKRSQQKSPESGHNLRFPGTFGTNRNRFYTCPTCKTYETKNPKQFAVHLYKEINYFRYVCNFCPHKSTHMAEAQKHLKESHSDENIVNNKEICTVLRYYAKAEKWVEKCVQVQQEGILQHERDLIKQENANSSTETLILDVMDERTPEKPELTPQHRRSARSALKLSQNDSFEGESTAADELLPPVLEPEVPDVKEAKKVALSLKCSHCSFVAKAQVNLDKHLKKHFEAKPYKCKLCKYAGSQLAHLQSHFHFKHPADPLQYTLEEPPAEPQCRPVKRKRTGSDAAAAASERPKKMAAIEEPAVLRAKVEPPSADDEPNNYYLCYHCPRRSPTLDLIRSHFLEAHEKTHKNVFKYKRVTIDKPKKTKYSCPHCEWIGSPDSLRQHHLQKHIDKEYLFEKDVQLRCQRCAQVFAKMAPLKNHFNRCHPSHSLFYQSIVKENDDEFIETIKVIEEMLQVKMEPPTAEINCTYCILSFRDVNALRAHHDLVHNHLQFDESVGVVATHNHDDLKKYKCPQCEHTSNSFAAMRDHLRNHNKPYVCGHCDLAASYPSIVKAHHMKEHRNLEASVLVLAAAQKRNDELRSNLLHLHNGEYIRMDNVKRQHVESAESTETTESTESGEPPRKVPLLLDEDEQKRPKPKRRKSIKQEIDPHDLLKASMKQPRKMNVARKSTATPPRTHNVAKKSTTPRPHVDLEFTYYGTRPLQFDDIKNIKSELPIMGKNVPLNIGSMSQILQLFPVVVLDDIGGGNKLNGI